ncbi:MAG: small basic protein [Planctomycetota bacterium]|nr:small basic protein [Planctomycetota bacterium]
MSLHKSLRSHGALARHRNVLTRAERIEKLKETGKWEGDKDIFALPKVSHRKVTTKKVKTAAAAGAAGAEGAAAAPAAGGASRRRGGGRPDTARTYSERSAPGVLAGG